MKLKRTASDFQVQEQIALAPRGGPFALYRLTKQSLGTPEAIDAILQRWNLSRGQVAYAGLKDRHAQTTQFVTIKGGPRQGLRQSNLELDYVGQASRPIEAPDITANRFVVVLRDMTEQELTAAAQALAGIAASGIANYFDDQRFGSLGESGEFIAKPWCLGDYERALWLAMAEPNVHDSPDEREQKRILRDTWGDWPKCKALLARSHRRSIITYLADKPGDFRRALALVRQDLRSIWLAAFQSHLWNQILAMRIRQACRPEQLVSQTIGRRDLPFFQRRSTRRKCRIWPPPPCRSPRHACTWKEGRSPRCTIRRSPPKESPSAKFASNTPAIRSSPKASGPRSCARRRFSRCRPRRPLSRPAEADPALHPQPWLLRHDPGEACHRHGFGCLERLTLTRRATEECRLYTFFPRLRVGLVCFVSCS